MAKTVYILNGPNLNLLGTREPEFYGSLSLENLNVRVNAKAASLGLTIDFRQTNSEGELIGWVHEAGQKADAIILNAAAFTHTSLALFDAVKAIDKPCVEVHLSNIYSRESFRHHSYISPAAFGIICGFGALGYDLALEALAEHL